jgi:hypothetical protein
MRRVTLTVFFCLAACGGTDMVKSSPGAVSERELRAQFLFSQAAKDVIASFARTASSDAIDTCLNAWVEELGPTNPSVGPISKPDVASLRGFLAQCLAVPGDLRAEGAARAVDPKGTASQDLRTSGAVDR